MFESKYNNFLTVLLIVIIIAIIGLLGFLGFTYYKNYATKKGASDYVDTFSDGIGEISEDTPKNTNETGNLSGNLIDGGALGNTTSSSTREKKVLYNGFEVLGTIEIPKTNVKYPILARVTKTSLENSVAVLYPQDAKLNTPGNVVIIGHNYRNGLFFSNNKKLSNGDKVYITDLSGTKVSYVIYNTFETTPEDTSFYNRDTNGAKEITLSTCNDDTSARLIIEAKAE